MSHFFALAISMCRVMIGIGEQVYSILLLTVFFIEVICLRFLPLILFNYATVLSPHVVICNSLGKKIHKVLVYNRSVPLHVHVWMMNFMVCLYVQIFATGFVPYLGKALNFLLLSWIYAYYCFEYVVHLHFFFFFL